MNEHKTKEWLAFTYHNAWYNKGAYAPEYASTIIYAETKKQALKQAKNLFGRWGKVELRGKAKLTRVRV